MLGLLLMNVNTAVGGLQKYQGAAAIHAALHPAADVFPAYIHRKIRIDRTVGSSGPQFKRSFPGQGCFDASIGGGKLNTAPLGNAADLRFDAPVGGVAFYGSANVIRNNFSIGGF